MQLPHGRRAARGRRQSVRHGGGVAKARFLLFFPAKSVTEREGERFTCHAAGKRQAVQYWLLFCSERRSTFGGRFCSRLLPEHFGVRRFVPHLRSPKCWYCPLAQKSKAGMSSQLTTGRKPGGSQQRCAGCRGRRHPDQPTDSTRHCRTSSRHE